MARWDKARYAIERRCTCRRGDRAAECKGGAGWHRVDGHDTEAAALADAYALGFDMYRVVDSDTGKVVTY